LANISRQGRRDVITSFLSLRVLLSTYSMKVYSLAVVLAPPKGTSTILSSANDTSSFSFYQRGSVTEFLQFFSRTVAERTPQGQRQSVQENNYTAHVYNRGGIEQLSGTLRV
jgi:synaptobrevin family protein YKT6